MFPSSRFNDPLAIYRNSTIQRPSFFFASALSNIPSTSSPRSSFPSASIHPFGFKVQRLLARRQVGRGLRFFHGLLGFLDLKCRPGRRQAANFVTCASNIERLVDIESLSPTVKFAVFIEV